MTRLERIAQMVEDYDIPRHREEVSWLLARVRGLEAVVRKLEYASDGWCGACESHTSNIMDGGHADDCALARALKNLEEE